MATIEKGRHRGCFPHPFNGVTARMSHRQPMSRKKRRVNNESRMDGFDVNRHDSFGRQLKNGVPAVFDQHWLSHPAIARCSLSKMKNITFFATLVLSFAALPCSARSGRRAGPPALLNSPALDILNGLNGSLCVFCWLLSDCIDITRTDVL